MLVVLGIICSIGAMVCGLIGMLYLLAFLSPERINSMGCKKPRKPKK